MNDATNSIRLQLINLMADLFSCEISDIEGSTGPGDVAGWDSLGHVSLMSEIENQFGIHVPVEDALEVTSVEDLAEILSRLSS